MNETKLPEWLAERMRAYAMDKAPGDPLFRHVCEDGWQACYAALLERAPEFDEAAAHDAAGDAVSVGESIVILKGARWQHEQLAAVIAAKDAEIERLREALEGYAADPTHYGQCAREALEGGK